MILFILQTLIIVLLSIQVKSQGGAVPKNVSQIKYGRVNVKDRIAYDLNDIFGAKKREERGTDKYFMVNNKAARVISSDPFTIREFKEDCTHFNKGHHTDQEEMFTVICEKNKFYEITVSKGAQKTGEASYKIKSSPYGIQFLAEFKDPDNASKELTCYDSTYYYAKNLYAVVCETKKIKDTRGDVLIFLVKRVQKTALEVTGKVLSMVRKAKSGKISFSEKRLIKMVKFNKGTLFSSEEQFMLYDEPFIYQGHQTTSKDNLFFIVMSVTGESGKEKFELDLGEKKRTARVVNIGEMARSSSGQGQITEFINLYRIVNIETIHGMLLISGYFDNVSNMVTALKCQVDTSDSNKVFKIKSCMKIKSKKKSDLAFQQFFQNRVQEKIKRVATYSRKTKTIRICNLNVDASFRIAQSSYEEGCAEVKARSRFVKDIAFGFFDNCDNYETCDAFWFDEEKKHFIGIDRYKISKTEISGTGQKYDSFSAKLDSKYFCYGNSGRMIGDNMFMAEEKFISGFNKWRSEEVLIRAELLQPGNDFYVTLYKSQAGTHEFINITGYRVKQMIYQITAKQKFPKFRGSLGEMYHVPLGRDYFNGNALTFKLNANKDIAKDSHIHYMLPGKIHINGESLNHRMFFYGHRSSVVVTSNWHLFFLRCLRKLEKGVIAMSCDKITTQDDKGKFSFWDLGKDHNLIGDFEAQEMHFVGTSRGKVFRYNRNTKKISEAISFGGKESKFIEVTFKDYGNVLIVAMLSEKGEIYIGKMNLFNDVSGDIKNGKITKYDGRKSSQETDGKFCPNSIYFSQTFHSHLVIVNSCAPEKGSKSKVGFDRRLITYEVTPSDYHILDIGIEMGLEAKNEFLRLKDLNGDKLALCTDKDMNFVANIGTKYAYGIGISTESKIEDMGLDELNVEVIHKMLCLGNKAIGLIVTDKQKRLTVITYFLGKFKDADNRIHSYFHLEGTFKDAFASEGEGLVFYNIHLNEDNKHHIMAVDLKGPDVFIKSTEREVAYETEIEVQNKRENQKFDILVEFDKLVKKGGVSHRKLRTTIKAKIYDNVESFTYWHGPVWSITYGGKAGSIVQTRLTLPSTILESDLSTDFKILSVDAIEYLDDRIFMLAQTTTGSKIIIKNDMPKAGEKPTVVDTTKVCQNLRVTMNYMEKVPDGYLFLTNCFIQFGSKTETSDGPHPRMTYFKLTKADLSNRKLTLTKHVYNKFKDFPSQKYDLVYLKKVKSQKKLRILDTKEQGLIPQGRILGNTESKEILLCFIHQHNRTMFMSYLMHGEQSGANKFELHHMYRDENGKFINAISPSFWISS